MISIFATGFVTKQPEIKYVGETPFIEFDVADTRREKKGGEFVTVYEYVTFVAWGEDALRYAERLTKGRNVEVMGVQKTSRWTSGDGQQRSKVKYETDRIGFPYQAPRENVEAKQVAQAPQSAKQPVTQRYANSRTMPEAEANDAEPKPLNKAAATQSAPQAPQGTKSRFASRVPSNAPVQTVY